VRRPLLAANWKMHFVAGDAARYLAAFRGGGDVPDDRDVLFAVPAPLLAEASEALAGTRFALGGQNLHWEEKGAFTGEVSGAMIAAAGATHCLVGHSERRRLFGEDDAIVARKLRAALRSGLRPVLCVGETLEERRAGRAAATVERQLDAALAELGTDALAGVEVAYEPVWAIGTGETATPQTAAEMHAAVRARLRALAGHAADRVRILYGGSVTPTNAAALLAEPDVDGALVGGASLDPLGFLGIVRSATQEPGGRPGREPGPTPPPP
jgi:triosephosphate isomerase